MSITALKNIFLDLNVNFNQAFYTKLGLTLGILFLLLLTKRLLFKWVNHREISTARQYSWRSTISTIINLLILVVILFFWTETLHVLITFVGLVSAALVITLKEPILSLAGRIYILWRKPFAEGDRIEINKVKGDVIECSLFRFMMVEVGNWVDGDQSTGRIVHLPNRMVFDHPIFNYSHGFHFIWDEIHLQLSLESDWKKAKEILEDIVQEPHQKVAKKAAAELKKTSERYLLIYKKLEPIVYMKVKEGRISLSLRFLCEPRSSRSIEHQFWDEILTRFQAENLQILSSSSK